MSHFPVVVCLDDPSRLEAVLAPFDENREVEPYRDYIADWKTDYERALRFYTEHPEDKTAGLDELDVAAVLSAYNETEVSEEIEGGEVRYYLVSTDNPQSKWDWYLIGGRWTGYFRSKADAPRDGLITGEPGLMTEPIRDAFLCDGGAKSALDLDGLRERKAEEARKVYAEFHALLSGMPDAKPWREFVGRTDTDETYTIAEARRDYHDQPRVVALRGTDFEHYNDAIATFQMPEALYVETARAQAVPGYAVVTLDGRWMAPGRLGWFGVSTDNESDRAAFLEVANAYIDSLPDTAWLIAVDCHI